MMELSAISLSGLTWDFCLGCLTVIVLDLVLAGDNAIIIALAVKSLPKQKRTLGIVFGAGFAVILRVILTVFVAQLLQINYVKLMGGAVILWIAVKLLIQGDPQEELHHQPTTMLKAIWVIIVADLTMSTDNVLALAGASKGDPVLLIFGLVLSIPLVVGASSLLSRLMDRFPILISIGVALLGKVGGEMIMDDPFTINLIQPSPALVYFVEVFLAVGVVLVARFYLRRVKSRERAAGGAVAPVLQRGAVLDVNGTEPFGLFLTAAWRTGLSLNN